MGISIVRNTNFISLQTINHTRRERCIQTVQCLCIMANPFQVEILYAILLKSSAGDGLASHSHRLQVITRTNDDPVHDIIACYIHRSIDLLNIKPQILHDQCCGCLWHSEGRSQGINMVLIQLSRNIRVSVLQGLRERHPTAIQSWLDRGQDDN